MDYKLAQLNIPDNGLKGDWYVYYSMVNPASGKMALHKERKNINRLKTIKERKAYGAEMVEAINELLKSGWSKYTEPEEDYSRHSLVDLLWKCFEIRRETLGGESIEIYKNVLNTFTKYLKAKKLDNVVAKNFTEAHANEYCDWMLQEKKYVAKTHNNHLLILKVFFGMLRKRYKKAGIVENPFSDIKAKKVFQGRHVAFTEEERGWIKNYMLEHDMPELLMFISCIFHFGTRGKEMVRIKRRHINYENWTILIEAETSKTKKQRPASIPVSFREKFEIYRDLDLDFYLFSKHMKPGLKKLDRRRVTERHTEVLKALGFDTKRYTMYGHKHSGAVAFLRAGGTILALMKQFGHASPSETMNYARALGFDPNDEFTSIQPAF